MWQTRRDFLKSTAGGGTAVLISQLVPLAALTRGSEAAVMNPPDGWSGAPGHARYRIDGLAKVTGQKIYARDFLPRDMREFFNPLRVGDALNLPSTPNPPRRRREV